jgi:hypothetical protein
VLILSLSFPAKATDPDDCRQGHEQCGHDNGDGSDGNYTDVDNDSFSESSSESVSTADSTADASASATLSAGGNSQSINFSSPKSTTVRNVPSPDTPNVYPSAPCRIARSAGLSFAGGSLSGGASIEDPECTLREAARVFQYLGVPEVGLHLMCTQSLVIIGRYDKKGNLEEGYGAPIGSAECLRLVRLFQGSDDAADASSALQIEVEILREQQDRIESGLVQRVDELEREQRTVMQVAQARPPPQVTQQTIQQPMLNDEKRAKLAALFGDNDEETSE